jgi:hypothetical protein
VETFSSRFHDEKTERHYGQVTFHWGLQLVTWLTDLLYRNIGFWRNL